MTIHKEYVFYKCQIQLGMYSYFEIKQHNSNFCSFEVELNIKYELVSFQYMIEQVMFIVFWFIYLFLNWYCLKIWSMKKSHVWCIGEFDCTNHKSFVVTRILEPTCIYCVIHQQSHCGKCVEISCFLKHEFSMLNSSYFHSLIITVSQKYYIYIL